MNKICTGFRLCWRHVLPPAAVRAAEMPAPDALAKKVTDEVLAILRADKDIQSGNKKKVLDLVEAKVLPHFNFARMTRLAVGKNWRAGQRRAAEGADQRIPRAAGAHLHQRVHAV